MPPEAHDPAASGKHAWSGLLRRAMWVHSTSRPALSPQTRAVIAARVAAGESLRMLAREYLVSHETIRRIAQAMTRTMIVT